MIDLAKKARERLTEIRTRDAVRILKEEHELEYSIEKSIEQGMSFTYVSIYELVNSFRQVMKALESFGYGVELTSSSDKLKVWW